jgi:hypothetical protein
MKMGKIGDGLEQSITTSGAGAKWMILLNSAHLLERHSNCSWRCFGNIVSEMGGEENHGLREGNRQSYIMDGTSCKLVYEKELVTLATRALGTTGGRPVCDNHMEI